MRLPDNFYLVKPGRYQAPLFLWKVTVGKFWAEAAAAGNGHTVRLRVESWLSPDFPHADFWLDGEIAAPRRFTDSDHLGSADRRIQALVEDAIVALNAAYAAHLAAVRRTRAPAADK
jgi:hypothetical protein